MEDAVIVSAELDSSGVRNQTVQRVTKAVPGTISAVWEVIRVESRESRLSNDLTEEGCEDEERSEAEHHLGIGRDVRCEESFAV